MVRCQRADRLKTGLRCFYHGNRPDARVFSVWQERLLLHWASRSRHRHWITLRHEVEKEGFNVTVEAQDLCPRYIAHYVYDVKLGQSPAWMRRRLALVGNNSISNIVDITNYINCVS